MSEASVSLGGEFRVEVLLDFFSESMGGDARTLTLQHVAVLGAGAMGEVHKVEIVRPGQSPLPAALKIALGDAVANRTAIVREAHVLRARIQDGVAQFLALVELPGGGVGLILTFEAGRPLEDLLEQGPLHPNDVIALGRRLFGVLAALHAEEGSRERLSAASLPQVVHGDIKPGNIMIPIDARGRPDFHQATLIDFGVARLQQRLAGAFTTDDVLGGTVGYMPIGHLVRGAAASSDVFAVTAVLYECLTGRAPWTTAPEDSETEIARMWALEKAMAAVPPAKLHWRDVRPWRHTRGWNLFFASTLAQGDTDKIPAAAVALERLEDVRRDRLFALSVAAVVLTLAAAFGLWMRFAYCPQGLVRCDGTCVDRQRDVVNCGACGHLRRGALRAGRLRPPAREARRAAARAASLSDRGNCGACGARAKGAVCAAGPQGQLRRRESICDGVCRDTRTDRAHCGRCQNECPAGQLCSGGSCVATCATGFDVCDGRCFNLQEERAHCGRCGLSCGQGQLCAHGRCVTSCTADLTNCAGSCRDLQSDRLNCGACGRRCGDGEGCRAGQCVRECPPGLSICADRCRDLASDAENCGACGTRCGDGDRCQRGRCAMSCGHGTTACEDACRDLARDSTNCGRCGSACGAGRRCEQGQCVVSCAPGLAACGGACRDLASDSSNCGGCGVSCGAGQRCEQGRCALTCAAGTTRCGDRCVSLASDNEQCGRCGRRCASEETCREGECQRLRVPPRAPVAPTLPNAIQPAQPVLPAQPAAAAPPLQVMQQVAAPVAPVAPVAAPVAPVAAPVAPVSPLGGLRPRLRNLRGVQPVAPPPGN
ncbi:MAG: protein kinase [Polyangiales bacterium]